jgi:hypothetical protein
MVVTPACFADDGKRDRSDSTDTDKPFNKKRRLLDSDEETDSPKNESIKDARVIISDDEEPSNVRARSSRVIISDEED